MKIVDAQVHLWSQGKTNPPHRAEPYSMEQVLPDMAAGGIDAILLHPPSWDPASNEISVDAASAYPNKFAILGRLPLDDPESPKRIAGWKSRKGMLGLRYTFLQPHMKSWPTDGTMDWLWPAAEQHGIPVALLCADFLPLVGEKAAKHPGLKLIVDHMGGAMRQKGAAARVHLPELVKLAKHPNVAVKATGGPGYAEDGYPFKSLEPWYKAIYDAFGPARMFWGTDITRMPCSWKQCVTAIDESLPWLKGADKELVMGRAVCDWIGWKM
jgi:predicted TIM-barrel fold metal-dependent hydrolase